MDARARSCKRAVPAKSRLPHRREPVPFECIAWMRVALLLEVPARFGSDSCSTARWRSGALPGSQGRALASGYPTPWRASPRTSALPSPFRCGSACILSGAHEGKAVQGARTFSVVTVRLTASQAQKSRYRLGCVPDPATREASHLEISPRRDVAPAGPLPKISRHVQNAPRLAAGLPGDRLAAHWPVHLRPPARLAQFVEIVQLLG